jgi:energy-coupling factor transporter ATPase
MEQPHQPMSASSIVCKDVTFHYTTQEEEQIPPALQHINLEINAGEMIAIIGHNGSGKSTLARLFAAILHPTSGSIKVNGIPTNTHGEALWTLRQHVGLVFQNPDDQLIANTVIDDVAFGPENLELPRIEIEERVQEALALLDLQPYAEIAINDLSVGQKQRVAIAGILAMRPQYLILDEPTTMISGRTVQHLLQTVHRLCRERHMAVMHITHSLSEIVDFDRVIVMHQGQVLADDTPTRIFAQTEMLQTIGLDVPMVTKLGQRLRKHGWNQLPEVIISTVHLKESISALV